MGYGWFPGNIDCGIMKLSRRYHSSNPIIDTIVNVIMKAICVIETLPEPERRKLPAPRTPWLWKNLGDIMNSSRRQTNEGGRISRCSCTAGKKTPIEAIISSGNDWYDLCGKYFGVMCITESIHDTGYCCAVILCAGGRCPSNAICQWITASIEALYAVLWWCKARNDGMESSNGLLP